MMTDAAPKMRCWLSVPGDAGRKMARAVGCAVEADLAMDGKGAMLDRPYPSRAGHPLRQAAGA